VIEGDDGKEIKLPERETSPKIAAINRLGMP